MAVSASIGRQIVDLNADWVFFRKNMPAARVFAAAAKDGEKVTIPHSSLLLPHHNFDEKSYQFVSWYRREFELPKTAEGRKKVFIEFDGVMLAAKVYVNGKLAGEHKGGYTPFAFDITSLARFGPGKGNRNVVAVQVDSRERPDIAPFGGTVDYLAFGGLYREARVVLTERAWIADAFPFATDVLSDGRTLRVKTTVAGDGAGGEFVVAATLLDSRGRKAARAEQAIEAPVKGEAHVELAVDGLEKVELWDIDRPTMYKVRVELLEGGKTVDAVEKPFGFREARFDKDGRFRLNGRVVKLIGLDRHQTYPYIGCAAPARLQRRDAEVLREELGLNIVRTSHYPQSVHFLDRCDELGLLVFEELPGWQHIGDAAWKANAIEQMKEMIVRDRHHPSIVLWGVRINESQDDHDFYVESNRVSRELDPTRQTGGVRCFRESEFLEDVFTYNEFSSDVREPNHVPYLITEFAGHTFPTKTFDRVERQIEHALLHTRIQDKQMGMPEIAGAIGWCAFDYNTHIDFGSGDRICYHGVSDIFRFPKFAAYLYMSQKDPAKQVVMELADFWARGDWNHCTKFLLIYSNCDEVLINGQLNGRAEPMRDEFPNLAHPPFRFDKMKDVWGHGWNDLELVGLIGGKVAIRKRWPADKLPSKLAAWTDSKVLDADGSDMTQLSFMMADRFGNVCPYATGAVTAKASGPVRIIGENPFALVGGRGALYVRSDGRKGAASIELTCTSGHKAQVKVKVG